MTSDVHFTLDKLIWSEADFAQMSFHDVHVHSVCFDTGSNEAIFDIDYIFRWVMPAAPNEYFTFWVSPATLVFSDVSDVELSWCGGACLSSML